MPPDVLDTAGLISVVAVMRGRGRPIACPPGPGEGVKDATRVALFDAGVSVGCGTDDVLDIGAVGDAGITSAIDGLVVGVAEDGTVGDAGEATASALRTSSVGV